jgi:hypothetical protein
MRTECRLLVGSEGLHAGSLIETPYCTQQMGGLARGITLRAVHTKAAIMGL